MDKWNQDKTDNHEEIPCEYFLISDHLPSFNLRWIHPCLRECTDILSYPYHSRHEEKSNPEIHMIVFFVWSKVYLSPSEGKENQYEDDISKISDKVMGEEIDIDRESDEYRREFFRISDKSKLEYPPDSSDIAPDRWVHKSCKKWYRKNPQGEWFRIWPWSNRWMCLKYFHPESHTMKYRDHSNLFPWFELHYDEKYLEYKCREKEKIISIYHSFERIPVFRQDDHEYEKSTEYTGVRLLRDEGEEVSKKLSHTIFGESRYRRYTLLVLLHFLHMWEIFDGFPYEMMSHGVKIQEGYKVWVLVKISLS